MSLFQHKNVSKNEQTGRVQKGGRIPATLGNRGEKKPILDCVQKGVLLALQLMFVVGVFTIVFLKPILLKFFGYAYYSHSPGYFDFMLKILYVSGPLSLVVLWQIISVLRTINNGNPFIHKNGQCLKRLSAACFLISLTFFINCCFYISPFAIILCIVFIIAGFFGLIFGELFHQAARVKEENDLTI